MDRMNPTAEDIVAAKLRLVAANKVLLECDTAYWVAMRECQAAVRALVAARARRLATMEATQ